MRTPEVFPCAPGPIPACTSARPSPKGQASVCNWGAWMTEAAREANRLATVFGGLGFLGRYIVRALVEQGWRIRVAVRRPDLAAFLQPIGGVGQIQPVRANLRF